MLYFAYFYFNGNIRNSIIYVYIVVDFVYIQQNIVHIITVSAKINTLLYTGLLC